MKLFRACLCVGAIVLIAPLAADTAAAQAPSANEKINAYVGCINRLSERSYEFAGALFQLGRQERPDRQGADHLRHLHDLRHVGLPQGCREGQRARAARRRARGRRIGLRGSREQARAAAQGGRRLLFPAGLQGRPDGQGQGAASATGGRMGCVRGRRPEAAQRRRGDQRQARGGAARRDRAQRRAQDALPCRGADDPRQARRARAGQAGSRTSRRSRRR